VLLAIPVAAEASTTGTTSTTQTTAPTAPTAPSAPTAPTAPSTSTNTSAPSTSTSSTSTKTSSTSTKTASTSGTTTTQTTPAPGGSAEAYALKLASILAISHTKANAGPGSASSTADPLELGGSNPPDPHFGGSGGNNNGALFDTSPQAPANQFRLAITPWSNNNSASSSQSTSSAMAQILYLSLGDPSTSQSANLSVLQSKSDATWTPAQSTGSSSSDGAILNLGGGASKGGLTVDLLHADANSSGSQSSYLVSINGNEIGSSSQVNGACVINIPSLLSLSCVTATGGAGSSAAEVVHTVLGPGTPLETPGDAFKATGSSSNGAPTVSGGSGGQTGNGGNGNGNGNGAAPAPTGKLAFTGLDVAALVGLALALGLGGVGLVWWSRRNRMSII